jgi:DedD protein
MDERVKRRLVGAVILVSLFVVLVPMVLDPGPADRPGGLAPAIPPLPEESFPVETLEVHETPPELAEAPADLPPEGGPFEEPPPDLGPPDPGEPVPALPPVGAARGARDAAARAATPQPGPGSPAEAPADGKAQVGLSAWAVQVGSFANAANAVALRDALRGRGFTAFVERSGERITRVYVGPEINRQRAAAARDRLARELKVDGQVVAYPGAGAAPAAGAGPPSGEPGPGQGTSGR